METIFFIYNAIFFLAIMSIHVFVWRVFKPKRQITALFLVFAALPAVIIALLFVASLNGSNFALIAPFEPEGWAMTFVLQMALSSAYVLTYPAIQAGSPSLVILLILGASEGKKASYEFLSEFFNEEKLFLPRLKDLVESGLVYKDAGVLRATTRGRVMIVPFMALRKILGLSAGRG